MVGGEVLMSNGKLVSGDLRGVRKQLENTVAFLQQSLGDETWASGMNPEIPEQEILTNPYQYTK
jgi:hypothetical protein